MLINPVVAQAVRLKIAEIDSKEQKVSDWIKARSLSIFDFLTLAEQFDVSTRSRTLDVTAGVQKCFNEAQRLGKCVYGPTGDYVVTNLLFGNQRTTTQSDAPLGLFGDSKNAFRFVAKAGTTGTVLQSWTTAGVNYSNFSVITTGTSAVAWDASWKVNEAPSTQCIIQDIRIEGGSAPILLNLYNMNDSYPTRVLVAGTLATQCCINMLQGGGLAIIRECIWTMGFLNYGGQSGGIRDCWGFGIRWAANCLNYSTVDGYYGYPNPTTGTLSWSESFAGGQSAKALIWNSCQFIADTPTTTKATAYFDINGYSSIDFNGCQFIGSTIPLLGPNCRNDSYAPVSYNIRGGSATPYNGGNLTLVDKPGCVIIATDFMNDQTGYKYSKSWTGTFTPSVGGSTGAGSTNHTIQTGTWQRSGNEVKFQLRVAYSSTSCTGDMRITGFPFLNTAAGLVGLDIATVTNTFAAPVNILMADSYAMFWGVPAGEPVQVRPTGDMIISGRYPVSA